jgi:adenosine deaminase
MSTPVDRSWIRGLPKAEVHLHLEGCIEQALIDEAVRRHRIGPFPGSPPGDGEDTDARPPITTLPQLLSYLDWSCALIDRATDLAAIAFATARRATTSGVRHVDVIFNPTHWPHWQGRLDTMVDALDDGFGAAEVDGLATSALCLSLQRGQTGHEALDLVDWILDRHHPRVAALSIDGDESGGSHSERFAPAFARAGAGGLRRCAHAGESSGPDGVRHALDILGVERIEHGIRCVEDPDLVAELARRSIPLGICPSSNVILGFVPDLPRHPIDELRRQGVPVSVNTDDPLLYGIDVAGEYVRCAETFGWGRHELGAVARTSITSCFADEDRRRQLLGELDAYVGAGTG